MASMSYAASVWFRSLRLGYAQDAINRCQRQVLYWGLNVCRTVSTDAMQVLFGELPWDLEATRKGLLWELKRGIAPIEGDPVTAEELHGLSEPECMDVVNARMFEIWQRRWDDSINGRITHEFIPDVTFASTHERFCPGLYLTYLLTEHGSMNAFLSRMSLSDVSECLCGAPSEDAKHIMFECTLYEDLRNLDACGLRSESGVFDVSGALSSFETYEALGRFADSVFHRRRELRNTEE